MEKDDRGGKVAIYPCPHCGYQGLYLRWKCESLIDFLSTGHWRYFFVQCGGCEWIGPWKHTKEEAIYCWNRCSPEFYIEDWTVRLHQMHRMQLNQWGFCN